MSRLRRRLIFLIQVLAITIYARPAVGQSTTSPTPPPTQTEALTGTLGLGAASGCFTLVSRRHQRRVRCRNALALAGNAIGNELRAICSPSAVTSASSLGGGLQSLQPVKTVTQFRFARSRIDQRLTSKPKPPPKPNTHRSASGMGLAIPPGAALRRAALDVLAANG